MKKVFFDRKRMDTEIYSKKYTTFKTEDLETGAKVFGTVCNGMIAEKKEIYRKTFYPWDVKRGYDGFEDLFSPVNIYFNIEPGNSETLYFSSSPLKSVKKVEEELNVQYPAHLIADELKNLEAGKDILTKLDYDDNELFSSSQYMGILNEAYRKFICNGKMHKGYPWYGCDAGSFLYQLPLLLKIDTDYKDVFTNMKSSFKMIKEAYKRKDSPLEQEEILRSSLWYIIGAYRVIDTILPEEDKTEKFFEKWMELMMSVDKVIKYICDEKELFEVSDNGMIRLITNNKAQTWNDSYYHGKTCSGEGWISLRNKCVMV